MQILDEDDVILQLHQTFDVFPDGKNFLDHDLPFRVIDDFAHPVHQQDQGAILGLRNDHVIGDVEFLFRQAKAFSDIQYGSDPAVKADQAEDVLRGPGQRSDFDRPDDPLHRLQVQCVPVIIKHENEQQHFAPGMKWIGQVRR